MQKQPVALAKLDDIRAAIEDNARCNSTALRKASRRVSQLYDAVLAPSGLRQTQRSLLMHIARLETPTLGALSASLVLDRSALSHNLKPLVREGLLVLAVDPEDRRSRVVSLTAKGEGKLRETAVLWLAAQGRFERKFGIARAKALRDTLAFIATEAFDEIVQTPSKTPSRKLVEGQ